MNNLVLIVAFIIGSTYSAPRATVDFNHFWSFDEISAYMHNLELLFPDVCHVELYGFTAQNRPLEGIHIDTHHDHQTRTDKEVIFIEAGLRPREWISVMSAVYFFHEMIEHYYEFEDILDAVEFVIIPVANPDGYVYSHTTNRQWNKNRQTTTNPGCPGVDVNANFREAFLSGSDPCSVNYAGASFFNAQESLQISNLISSSKYAGRISAYVSLQAFGEQVLMPFSSSSIAGGNTIALTNVANRIANAIQGRNPLRNYQVGVGGALRTPQSGTSTDYALGFIGIPYVFTLMLPSGGASGFDPPTTVISSIGSETFYGLLEVPLHLIGQ